MKTTVIGLSVLSLGVLLSSCDTVFTGSREPGSPISLIVLDKRANDYVFRRLNFEDTSGTDRLQLKLVSTGSPFTTTPIGLQVSQGGNRLYLGFTDRIVFYTDEEKFGAPLSAPKLADQTCSIQNFRVNDAETYLAGLVSCGDPQNVTQQKLWVRSLLSGGTDVLIDNPIPSDQPITVAGSPSSLGYGIFPYALTNTQLYFVKNVIGDTTSSYLYTLALNTTPSVLPIGYVPEKVVAVNSLGTASLNLDGGTPLIGGLAATRDGVYRIEESGKLGGKLLPEAYKALWSVSTSALKRVALWNPDLSVNFTRTLRFYDGSSNPTVSTQGAVRDLTFAPVTGNAYYLDSSSLVQVDVSSPPVNNSYRSLSQDYASLGLENPISIGWILTNASPK